jgi:hypothetical protein
VFAGPLHCTIHRKKAIRAVSGVSRSPTDAAAAKCRRGVIAQSRGPVAWFNL